MFHSVAGEDFEGISFDLTVRPSDVRRCVAILILEDSTVEPDESFTVTVSLAELILSTTTVTILDDDGRLNTHGLTGLMLAEFIFTREFKPSCRFSSFLRATYK